MYRSTFAEHAGGCGCLLALPPGWLATFFIAEWSGWPILGVVAALGATALLFGVVAVGFEQLQTRRRGRIRCEHGQRSVDGCEACDAERRTEVERKQPARPAKQGEDQEEVHERLVAWLARRAGEWPWNRAVSTPGPTVPPQPPQLPARPSGPSSAPSPSKPEPVQAPNSASPPVRDHTGASDALPALSPLPAAGTVRRPTTSPTGLRTIKSWLVRIKQQPGRALPAGVITVNAAGAELREQDRVFLWVAPDSSAPPAVVGYGLVRRVVRSHGGRPESAGVMLSAGLGGLPCTSTVLASRMQASPFGLEDVCLLDEADAQALLREIKGKSVQRTEPGPTGTPVPLPLLVPTQPTPSPPLGAHPAPRAEQATQRLSGAGNLSTRTSRIGRRTQGRGLPALARRAVELRAMQVAREHYEGRRYRVQDVSAQRSFDLLCLREGEALHVEVKGTTGEPDSVLITAAEERLAREVYPSIDLFVVHGIRLTGRLSPSPVATGGDVRRLSPWDVTSCRIEPVTSRCHLPPVPAAGDQLSFELADSNS